MAAAPAVDPRFKAGLAWMKLDIAQGPSENGHGVSGTRYIPVNAEAIPPSGRFGTHLA